jgi:lipopolysaccharide transport LptD-like protein
VLRWQLALGGFILTALLPLEWAGAQVQPPSDKLIIGGGLAYTWNDGKSDILQIAGPVSIRLDRLELSADHAVIWLSEEPGLVIPQQRAEIALIGNAVLREPARGIVRSGPNLFVVASVRGDIRYNGEQRLTGDQSNTPIFAEAARQRQAATSIAAESRPIQPTLGEGEQPPEEKPAYLGPQTRPAVTFRFEFGQVLSVPMADDSRAFELSGSAAIPYVTILQTRSNGDLIAIQAERAVVFTGQKARTGFESGGDFASMNQNAQAAYLEGDVRIDYTPGRAERPEQRLWAARVYYDFVTNQAVLTDAVMRSVDPTTQIPITVRAEKLRQLSQGEYRGEQVELSTSSFATPTYSVKTDQVYLQQTTVPVVEQGEATFAASGATQSEEQYVATGNSLRVMGAPVLGLPQASGSVDQEPYPLRNFQFGSTKRMGTSVQTEWGLYEVLGQPRPTGLDVSFLSDYLSRRGPATGLNAEYSKESIDSDNGELTDFNGLVRSYIITDHATDEFGGNRSDVTPPDQIRGKFLMEHQEFFPDGWQAQFRFGYVSDPTFMEEYFPREFYDNQPYDAVAYLKRQQDTEAITFLLNADTNRFVTTSDQQQEQFDTERLPEIGYHRIGDSFADDQLTFFSDSTADRVRFDKSHYSLDQQGFITVNPGLPSEGYTGTVSAPDYRGDTRQEVDWPVQIGQIKAVPYMLGRLTAYTDSPGDDGKQRVFGAAGVRLTTDFWKVDDTVQSDLFDLDRIRHIIEPEVNLFTSGETVDRSKLYIYDENVDGISDVSVADIALHQRWETYRGAPGREESVTFLSWNVSADMYSNPPKDPGLVQNYFRGVYFPSDPEASIPRDGINSDLTWLISDAAALLADESTNVDHGKLATASVGLAVKDYDRLAYYLGLRYIEPLDSDLATFAVQYQLTAKYTMEFSQSYDFGQNKDTNSEITLRRRFDVLTAEISVYHDSTTGDSGVRFNLYPQDMTPARTTPDIDSFFSSH